jgi:hypothetical protein
MSAAWRRPALGLIVTVMASATIGDAQIPPPPPASIGGCPNTVAAFHTCALQKAKTFVPPRTESGKPNLQGYWRSLLTQPFSIEGVKGDEPLVGDLVMPWEVAPGMIVDPPDGRIPYQPWATAVGRRGVNFEKFIDPRTACGPGGVPRLALQDVNQIIQATGDGHVLWLFEDHHVNRIIAMDGGPAPGADIKLRVGHSRGRWDGNTLVVDVTNLNGFTWFDDSGNFYTDTAHLVERLTLIDPDTIHYEVTVEDPRTYTRPWTLVWALVREKTAGFELLEEACWEGERDLPLIREQGYQYYFGEPWQGR